MSTAALRLVNGKFYRGNEEVKPEFGNSEMIQLLREAETRYDAGYVTGTVHNEEKTTYTGSIHFKCPKCNSDEVYEFDDEQEDWHFDGNDYKDAVIECGSCNTEFTVVHTRDMKRYEVHLTYEKEESDD
jgi:DNA-directed RNA polymerase subunit M/transcription elongation factor TFIIS